MERNTILIVDDAEINRNSLRKLFEYEYQIIEAEDGQQAIEIIKDNSESLALILLDLEMPKKTGFDVLIDLRKMGLLHLIPVIMITGSTAVETEIKAYDLGASDIIYKPFEPAIVLRRSYNIMELYRHRISIEKELESRTEQLINSQKQLENTNHFLINALSSVIEFRSLESGQHINRVKMFTNIILKKLQKDYPEYNITDEQLELISNAAALHDIGKIAIPDSILLKPGRLTDEEFAIMKEHTTKGCEILDNFKQKDNEFYKYCYDICRYHHERYDGNGYPDKLAGEDIPIWAQVVSIVDVYDALISKRVYKEAYGNEEALQMILDGQCGIFSPKIMDCFLESKDELYEKQIMTTAV